MGTWTSHPYLHCGKNQPGDTGLAECPRVESDLWAGEHFLQGQQQNKCNVPSKTSATTKVPKSNRIKVTIENL